jgi:hypothetical protein
MAYIYTTNYPIILLLNTPEIYRRHIRIEFTQICLMVFTEMLRVIQVSCANIAVILFTRCPLWLTSWFRIRPLDTRGHAVA